MGAFIESSLGADEHVMLEAKPHWVVFVVPVLLVLLGLAIGDGGLFFAFIGVIFFLVRLAGFMTTELAVTNRKVLAKFGVFRRSTIEQQLGKIDSIQINQGILSRMLGAGSVTVNGSGLSTTPIPGISDPLGFRRVVNEAMEAIGTSGNPGA